ncbi:M20/M25/M40 family metallo-hydrolase [Vaginisenegalia massiliensis]|uniref:M20/M25/M40 family metallo-hydrolase n=1 Tax=Vaginisenegalia massiliensis TaxID=2058294 RepID=UPI000F54AC79|nr:M20/M25/M40 family metallo-hydrolase [Vaginisenegalia massiliensis]
MTFFQEHFSEHLALCESIFNEPELGFKEFKTKAKIMDFIRDKDPHLHIEEFSTTGLRICLDNQADRTMGLIAEMDALINPSHLVADKETGAAHACGHYSQVAVILAVLAYLLEDQHYQQYNMNFCILFVPAEEFVDLTWRQQMIEEGKLTHLAGKPELMKLGAFDGVDFALAIHSIGEEEGETIEVNCDLAGFLYKNYHFEGQASHAGWDPFTGVNAYSMSNLFNVALGFARQQIREDAYVRINPIISQGNFSTNVIPDRVTIGTDLRTNDLDYMNILSKRLDEMAKASASALGGQVILETQMGYLPFVQDRYLNSFVKTCFESNLDIKRLIEDRGTIAAAGDIGDLSYMMPCIQVSYGGFSGRIHGQDFKMVNPHFVLETFPSFLIDVIGLFSQKVERNHLYHRSYLDYQTFINQIAL